VNTIERSCRLVPAVCLLLTAFCLLPSVSAATWSRQKSGTMSWLHSIYFLDQNHGWVAGSSGTLLETTDGGTTWSKVSTTTRDTLRDVCFVDNHIGWLVAERDVYKLKTNDEARSYLLHTDDGGLTWRAIYLEGFDTNARLVRLMFTDASNGWVFGETGVIFATHDSGASWTRQTPPTKHLLLGGAFLDNATGWLVGAGATIIRTSNSGATWQSTTLSSEANVRFNAASFIDRRFGWAVGSSGRVFATVDGGRAWIAQRSNVDSDLMDVRFVSATEGWVAGSEGTVLHTTDGGRFWFHENTDIPHALERLFFTDRSHGWAVGYGGTILKYGQSSAPTLNR